jgi:hypothetical protein
MEFKMTDIAIVRTYIMEKFSEVVGLQATEVFGKDLPLASIITLSGKMTNSVDLMEAFARTANALRKEHGVHVRLPAMSLDTPISKVLETFLAEYQKAKGS